MSLTNVAAKWRVIAPVAAAACLMIAVAVVALPMLSNQDDSGIAVHTGSGSEAHTSAQSEQPPNSDPLNTTAPPPTTASESPATAQTSPTSPTATSGNQTPTNPDSFNFSGLPTRNLSLANAQWNGNSSGDRASHHTLQDFLVLNASFAFVRVTNVSVSGNTITTTLQTLETVHGSVPQTFTVSETVRESGVISAHYTAISHLREGGVYLLPLADGGTWGWYIVGGNMDVLFEVGENGNIWSHARHASQRGFTQFDNRHASVVAQAVIDLAAHRDFAVATTNFGQTVQWGYEIVERTFGDSEIEWQGNFEQGARYLAFLATDSYGATIHDFYSARINDDGTITADSGVFAELSRSTPAQVRALAQRADAWWNFGN
jgi:hypothetical protein